MRDFVVMTNIEILNLSQADDSFLTVRLTKGTCPECFVDKTACIPNKQGGFDIFLDDSDNRCIQKAGRNVGALGIKKVIVTLDQDSAVKLDAISAAQFVLGMYSEQCRNSPISIAFDLNDAILKSVRRDVEFITLARIFANSANNQYHTVDLVNSYYQQLEKAFNTFGGQGKLSFELYKKGDSLFDYNCIGLQTVGKSSSHEPCLAVIDYVGPNADEQVVDIALVGKGIAFDTGGNDIKSAKFMDTMRTDKSGLIYVAAATALAAAMGANKHIRCYMPCAENMVSGNAMVPGDIITYPNNVSVEIGNTDAEGRLILADALLLAAQDKPKYILDAATLTGAAKIAVGRDMCAILCRENVMDEQLEQAFNYTKEEYWVLPMREYHKRYITSRRADICNTSHGDGAPGSSTAAAFLSFFVSPEQKWTHIDLSNAYQGESSPYLAPGSTGNTVYALAHWLVGAQY